VDNRKLVLHYGDLQDSTSLANLIREIKPKEIYNQLNDKYIASLFGDVNEFVFKGKQFLVYPHQLKITNKSDLVVEVLFSYFRGNQYLVEAKFENQVGGE
jgi:hypothetical protein